MSLCLYTNFGGVTLILVSFVLKIYCSRCRDLHVYQIWRGTNVNFSCKNQFCKIHCEIISRSQRGHSEVIGCALDHNKLDLQVLKIWASGDQRFARGGLPKLLYDCQNVKYPFWGSNFFFLGNEKKYFFFENRKFFFFFFENRKIIFFFKIEK